jgi:UDP-N-acetylmuramyl pentapeptide phosphotransferase/UDP-N-acetylglucosamine-1-phosphate transferase
MFQIPLLILLISIFLLSFCLTFLIKCWAIKQSILDVPNERSSHELPTPSGGGIAIMVAFYSALIYLYFTGYIEKSLFFALLPGLVLTVVGFVDDIRKLSWTLRLIIQFLCSGIALIFLNGMEPVFGNNMLWLWSMLALIGMVWFINLFNFLDGTDGYASMETISVSLALWVLTGSNIFLFLVFSTFGFLYWNWPKAKIFMGDSGSTTIGFLLAVLGIYFHNNGTLSFYFWLLLTALFWFDATITIIRRIIHKEKFNQPHRKHIYQRAIQGGFSHFKTLLSGLVINIFLFFICLAIESNLVNFLIGFLLSFIILLISLKYVDHMFPFEYTNKPSPD